MKKPIAELEFCTSPEEVLEILTHSKEHGNLVGIGSPLLGSGMFLTAVERVVQDYETIIYFKPYDVNGDLLPENKLKLTAISVACAFRSSFNDLYHKVPKEQNEMSHMHY